jgi:hypothetical protein
MRASGVASNARLKGMSNEHSSYPNPEDSGKAGQVYRKWPQGNPDAAWQV